MRLAPPSYAELPSACYSLLAAEPQSVLLQTSRFDEQNYRSYLFVRPLRVIAVRQPEELPALFREIERCLAAGLFAAGFLSYECGYHFQGLAGPTVTAAGLPLAWMGIYARPLIFNHRTGSFEAGAPPPPSSEPVVGGNDLGESQFMPEREYAAKIQGIRDYISAGDTYQVNFTDRLTFSFAGSRLALFHALRRQQRVSYNAFLRCDDSCVLSFSPELFFRVRRGQIITRPMKGTAHRGRDVADDVRLARWLHADLKNRAENVMIVDLLRNDLGRICQVGTIRVDELFTVEKYETLFQMTSTISGELRPEVGYYEMFASLFPCGSVTGAPKIRTMQIIRELERGPRGVYTGAIGFFSPQGEAVFNVPIRTLVVQGERGEMGVGSGIVADSSAGEEYRECMLKAEFLTRRVEPFCLLESILWDGDYAFLPQHLQRLESSAQYFDFAFERSAVTEEVERNRSLLRPGTRYKVRLLLDPAGTITIENLPVPEQQAAGGIVLSPRRTNSSNRFLYHKTTQRPWYEPAYAEAAAHGFLDVIFRNERQEITEGAISNIFVEKAGRLYTPPVSCGLLPGVYRQHLLESRPGAQEKVLYLDDLLAADAIYICNAVRGIRKVTLSVADSS